MIDSKISEKYHLPPIEEYPFPERDWYVTFLIQSDYVALKAAEALYTGQPLGEEIAEIIQARAYARQRINEIDEEAET